MANFSLKTKLPLPETQVKAITAETAKRVDKVALRVQQKYQGKVRPFSSRTRPTFIHRILAKNTVDQDVLESLHSHRTIQEILKDRVRAARRVA